MKTTTYFLAPILLVASIACSPASSSTGDDDAGDDGVCETYSTGPIQWVRGPAWTTGAQTIDHAVLDDLLGGGDWIRDETGCLITSAGGHVCLVDTECGILIGVPLDELPVLDGECDEGGPWSASVTDGTSICLAVFDGVGVLLDT